MSKTSCTLYILSASGVAGRQPNVAVETRHLARLSRVRVSSSHSKQRGNSKRRSSAGSPPPPSRPLGPHIDEQRGQTSGFLVPFQFPSLILNPYPIRTRTLGIDSESWKAATNSRDRSRIVEGGGRIASYEMFHRSPPRSKIIARSHVQSIAGIPSTSAILQDLPAAREEFRSTNGQRRMPGEALPWQKKGIVFRRRGTLSRQQED